MTAGVEAGGREERTENENYGADNLLPASPGIAANICGVAELVKIARAKGHYTNDAGILWFIGLFGTALMVGLIVCALPDRAAPAPSAKTDEDALPEV